MTHRPRKRFGQNFLRDPAIIHRIVMAVDPQPGNAVVEIGPGRGALTRELLRVIGALEAVELDRDLIPPLQLACQDLGDLRVHNADALTFNFCGLRKSDLRLRIVGNLPYNISTPLLFHLLDQAHCIQDMHFMLQKEVVERITAQPGESSYGRLSVMVQYHCQTERLFDVGPGAFRPRPKVDSSMLRLAPYREPPVHIDDLTVFSQVVAKAFGQRRKTLRNSLKELLSAQQMEALDIDPGLRPQTLGLDSFARLANALKPPSLP